MENFGLTKTSLFSAYKVTRIEETTLIQDPHLIRNLVREN